MIGPRTLFGKLLILFLGFGALMTGVFLFMMRISHERYHRQFDQQVNQDLARHYVAADLLVLQPGTGKHPFGSSLRRITAINPNVDVYVLDAQGHILDASVGDDRILRSRIDVAPLERFLQGPAAFPLLGDDPVELRDRDVFSAAKLLIPGSAAAYLYVVLNRHEEAPAAARLKTRYAIGEDAGVVLAATVLAFLGSVVFLRMLTRRLSALEHDIERFRDDRFGAMPPGPAEVGPSPADEIERLRQLFVQLAARIREQMQELHKTDDMRRELLANVSHDLRTPLTTLQTHLETLSMKDDLAGQEQRNYLAISLQQCRRLVKLVDQLLELAKLDARQMPFAPEPFQLAELAQDVVLKSALSARRAGVTLSMEPPRAEVPLVLGDVALIERVLDNMLENAIRYARTEGSVTVSVNQEAQLVRLAVHDTGSGIPESERERVFDWFYRGEKHRSTASGHAGLGLSIARGILELHGRSIDFVSAPDRGTTFFFELPVVFPPALTHDHQAGSHSTGGSAAAQAGR